MKFEIGDLVVINNDHGEIRKRGEKFKIKTIRKCKTGCELGRNNICPGQVNGFCYGFTKGYVLTVIGKGNPNNDILIKKRY